MFHSEEIRIMTTPTTDIAYSGRGRPPRKYGSVTIAAHLRGKTLVAWKKLLEERSEERPSVLLKKCLLVLLAIHTADSDEKMRGVYARFTQTCTWGKVGSEVLLAEYLSISPFNREKPIDLAMLEGIGRELNNETRKVSVRFSEEWFLRWQQACATLPTLLPGQILGEAVYVGAATLLSGVEGRPRVIILFSDGHSMTLQSFLGI